MFCLITKYYFKYPYVCLIALSTNKVCHPLSFYIMQSVQAWSWTKSPPTPQEFLRGFKGILCNSDETFRLYLQCGFSLELVTLGGPSSTKHWDSIYPAPQSCHSLHESYPVGGHSVLTLTTLDASPIPIDLRGIDWFLATVVLFCSCLNLWLAVFSTQS